MDFNTIVHIMLLNWKRIITVTFLSTILLFLIFLFAYPVTYSSTAVILPPEKNTSFIGLSSILAQQNMTSLLSPSLSNASSQLYAEILKSRSASLYVIKKLNLQNEYDEKDINLAAIKLSQDLNVELTKEGMVKISVDYSSKFFPLITDDLTKRKEISALISNTFVEALDKINREKLSSKSKKARVFLESQIIQTRKAVDSLETLLQNFQKKNKALSVPDQLKASIENAVKLKSEIAQVEIELGLMKYNVQEDDKIYQSLIKKLEQLKNQYNKLEYENDDYLLAFEKVPDVAKELTSLLREVKIQNEVYIFLQQQYYKEKIEENRDLPTVDILDSAIPPSRASSPRIFFSSFLGGVFAFIVISLLVLYKEKNTYNKS
ncbi:MAG: Wzz/FepE/Etk N-terminal domain-containing protein [Ignavibacterium album]|uniref:GumC family protein n=1 Tax=Ignavibacterium album TaxID=591197 RepID=UPI0026F21D36|nr:Wzz/FepE/Etk N-terminal domain-containing protein [Ignavibacterium album]MCX8106259.1 Wzz/FepE/Etk N-terminal domain-containing protein [Ignavibacterium album]